MIKRLPSAGDTIIEVLLAIAVLGSVLSGAYATAGRSQKNIRQAQERGEALQLVQSQIEQIRVTSGAFTTADNFCIKSGGAIETMPESCNFGAPEARYNIMASRSGDNDVGHTFKLTAVWDSINGGQDRIETSYRAYKQ